MIRERIADNVYWFQSEVYAQVTAGAIIGPDWVIVVDTLAIPNETLEMRGFIEDTLGVPVRYVINTIYHADHTFGNYFFPGATIVGHEICRQLMAESNARTLKSAQEQDPEFNKIDHIVLPDITLNAGSLNIQIGKRSVEVFPAAGTSPDGLAVLIKEDRVLFAGDAFLPMPNVVEGDADQLKETIKHFKDLSLENIVQGHGDVILRGEIDNACQSNIDYLNAVERFAQQAAKKRDPQSVIEEATIQACGKSRVLLAGLVEELHTRNLTVLYQRALQAKEE
jgi:glyoxylase-like metal-dependent hydrolase (beta-lactamase superfamily II)